MFWETKFSELQKLAPVTLIEESPGQWRATLNVATSRPSTAIGITKAAAICDLWSGITSGNEPFKVYTDLDVSRFIRWNGRWEDVAPPESKPLPIIEEMELDAFDVAD